MSDEYKFVGSDYSFKMGPTGFHVKLRPGILKLLEFLQSRFELWVYSNGRAEYVHKILNYIGQLGPKIDSSRVLPRDGNNYNKRLSR